MSDTVNIFTKILNIFSNRGIYFRLTVVTIIWRPMIYPFFLSFFIDLEMPIFSVPLLIRIRRPVRFYGSS